MAYKKYEPQFTNLSELVEEKKRMKAQIELKQKSFGGNLKDAAFIVWDNIKNAIFTSPKRLLLSLWDKLFKRKKSN